MTDTISDCIPFVISLPTLEKMSTQGISILISYKLIIIFFGRISCLKIYIKRPFLAAKVDKSTQLGIAFRRVHFDISY